MALIRLLQESDLIKTASLYSMKTADSEVENLKQIILEKDVIISNHSEKIQELEAYIAELKLNMQEKCKNECKENSLNVRIKELEKYARMPEIVINYEKLISKITGSYEATKEQCNVINGHLACLEYCFTDLLQKYERLKDIIIGYQENQTVLLSQIEEYQNAIDILEQNYKEFKIHANGKLNEANQFIESSKKKHISEMARAKCKVLENKVQISELEKKLSILASNKMIGDVLNNNLDNHSIFTPLTMNF